MLYDDISTHALLAEGDATGGGGMVEVVQFQPTPSLRRATDSGLEDYVVALISTHALLAEGDSALV